MVAFRGFGARSVEDGVPACIVENEEQAIIA